MKRVACLKRVMAVVLLGPLVASSLGGCSGDSKERAISVSESGLQVEGERLTWDAADWPAWRGPTGDGQVLSRSLPTQWSEQEGIAWSSPVPGRGHGSPTIVDGVVYLSTAIEDQQRQLLLAYDAENGELLWEQEVSQGGFPSAGKMHQKSTHANGTVACDGDRVMAAFLHDGSIFATALDLNGDPLWETEVGQFRSKFGYAPSPILYRSVLILAADHRGGGFIAALDRESGEIVWRTSRPNMDSYSSPLIANLDGSDQLLICGCHRVCSYDPLSGEMNWEVEGTTTGTCGTVVSDGSHVFASGGFPGRETLCVKGDGSGKRLWDDKRAKLYEPSLIYTNGLLFGVSDEGVAYCWDAADGERKWDRRLDGKFSASPIVCDRLIYVSNDRGLTFVFKAEGSAYQEVARNQLGTDTYASPGVSNSSLFLRAGSGTGDNRQEHLYRIDP